MQNLLVLLNIAATKLKIWFGVRDIGGRTRLFMGAGDFLLDFNMYFNEEKPVNNFNLCFNINIKNSKIRR